MSNPAATTKGTQMDTTVDYYERELVKALISRGHTEEKIKAMSPKRRFEEYCRWKGFSDWGDTLWATVEAAKAVAPDAIESVCQTAKG